MVAVEKIQFPIILIDGNDILFFKDFFVAERYLEKIDIDNNVYECFDAEGKALKLKSTITFKKKWGFIKTQSWKIEIEEIESKKSLDLAEKIRKILYRINKVKKDLSDAELPELIDEGIKIFGLTEGIGE
jgi:hypothetical protein